jgi:secreted trypsin-like serine protease
MRRTLLALVSAAMLAVTMVVPATAITGNYVDDNDHPFVGLIAFYSDSRGTDGAFLHRCTGSLVDDGTPADGSRVVVTAGHCTDDGTGDAVAVSARMWFRQDAGTRYDGTRDPLTGYPDKCIDDKTVALDACVMSHEMYNYGFDNFAGFPNHKDAGVIILDKPVILPEYGTITEAGAITSNKSVKLTVSGYGISDGHAASDPTVSFRERLMATTSLVNTTNPNTAGFNLETQPNGGGRGGTCSGDSGGPVFYPSTSNVIVAVTSFGIINPNDCQGNDYSYRLDRQEVIDWIDDVAGNHWNQ